MKSFYNSLNNIKDLSKEKEYAVSVSGGVDSNTLLFLLNSWTKERKKKLTVIYFNHNLRKDSQKDYLLVKKMSSDFSLKCILLNWNEKPSTAILEKARIARYQAISKYCKKNSIHSLFTGHHADDVAETVAMRIFSNSSIDGLCPIIKERHLFGIKLIRPMLELRKKQIYAFAKENNIKFIEDPSNKNTKTLRAKIRSYLESERSLTSNLIKSSNLFCKLRKITEKYIKINFQTYYHFFDSGYISIEKEVLSLYPEYMLNKFLKICLMHIGNKTYPPKSKSLKNLIDTFYSGKKTNATISGCIVSTKRKKIFIMREFNNINKNVLEVEKNSELKWDNRFLIRNLSNRNKIIIFPLGNIILTNKFKKLSNISKKSFNILPYMVKINLPVIKSLEGSIYIPHLYISSDIDLMRKVSVSTTKLYN